MRLCIPTLCRYDLLKCCIESAEQGTMQPSGYFIIDNGGNLSLADLAPHDPAMPNGVAAMCGGRQSLTQAFQLLHPDGPAGGGRYGNLGVAASWNEFLRLREPVIICNDDIVLAPDAIQKISSGLATHAFVEGYGFALFGIRPDCVEAVGFFDEGFFPAYYEDCDYELRLRRAGIERLRFPAGELGTHAGWATTEHTEDPRIKAAPETSRAYFIQKWGAITAHCGGTEGEPGVYAEPFQGDPPPGWARQQVCPPKPRRWEVINTIARHLDAKRYLEIGVAHGDSIRRVDVPERWGVDPVASLGAAQGASVVIPKKSLDFFRDDADKAGKFDIVFIDGDHQAELVYAEIQAALKCLTPEGVIVLHDCNPATEAMQTETYQGGAWCGTVWRAVVKFRARDIEHSMRVVDSDYGIGIIVPGAPEFLSLTWEGAEVPWEIPYAEFDKERGALLGLVSGWEWEEWFKGALKERAAGHQQYLKNVHDQIYPHMLREAEERFKTAEQPRFEDRPPVILTPAELQDLKSDPERWARYQAWLAAHSEKLSGG